MAESNELIAFAFEGAKVHAIKRDGEPWFILAEVCRVLAIGNVGNASARLDDNEKGSIRNPNATSAGGNPNIIIVNESGLYSLIMNSRKHAAKRFRKWVTADVLPTIRKTGGYGIDDAAEVLNDPAKLRELMLENVERVLALQAKNEILTPKARALDRLAEAEDSSMNITAAAKVLRVGGSRLVEMGLMRRFLVEFSRSA